MVNAESKNNLPPPSRGKQEVRSMALQHLKTQEFESVVSAAPVALLDFWAEWCGPCRMVSPIIEELAGRYDGKAVIAKVNVDEEGDLARRFHVMSIPTVILFKDGKEIARKVGAQSTDVYTDLLDANL